MLSRSVVEIATVNVAKLTGNMKDMDMNILVDLYISRITEENYWAEYHIGTFRSKEEAITAMKWIMGNGGQFSAPACKARTEEVSVIGDHADIDDVYRFYGQNLDSTLEGDMIVSPYYVDKSAAIREFIQAKKETPRQKWDLETYQIGKCSW